MRYIVKRTPPEKFSKYANSKKSSYKDLSENHIELKNELRASLIAEQGYICCYCGCRIAAENSIIEHLKPKSLKQYVKQQLAYGNLLASCKGGRNKGALGHEYPSTCDNHKENKEIKVHPLVENCEDRFIFDEEGNVIPKPEDIEAIEAITILNLNCKVLANRRKAALANYKVYPDNWNWEEELIGIDKFEEGKLNEFCFVIKSYILNFKLNRLV